MTSLTGFRYCRENGIIQLTGAIALALGAGWACGLNLYAAILVLENNNY